MHYYDFHDFLCLGLEGSNFGVCGLGKSLILTFSLVILFR